MCPATEAEPSRKQYIGDGVYADVEHGMIKLTTEDGISVSNVIYLEPTVWESLKNYVEALNRE